MKLDSLKCIFLAAIVALLAMATGKLTQIASDVEVIRKVWVGDSNGGSPRE